MAVEHNMARVIGASSDLRLRMRLVVHLIVHLCVIIEPVHLEPVSHREDEHQEDEGPAVVPAGARLMPSLGQLVLVGGEVVNEDLVYDPFLLLA